jgi:amidase
MGDVVADLWRMGATELAGAIRHRQVSSREVVQAHLQRVEAVDPGVNAVTVLLADEALAAADAADRLVAAGGDLPPLLGVPFTVKGNIDLVGTPTTQGATALAEAYPTRDAPVVERMRAAGAIPLGRTNLTTYAIRWHTDSQLWGVTSNPWDRTRTPGGSSGGEAVARATGMCPIGLGNDTLGSLRWPAQCCGVTALKRTLGRIPDATTVGPTDLPIGPQLAGVQGPVARHVADLRMAFEVLAGPTWRDPWSVPVPLRGSGPLKPVRVAIVLDPAGAGTASQVQDGLHQAAAALTDAGYVIDEAEPPLVDAAARLLLDMLNPVGVPPEAMRLALPSMSPETERFLVAFNEVAGRRDPIAALMIYMTRSSLLRAWGEFQEQHPLIVAPISTDIPSMAGSDLAAGRVAADVQPMRMALAVNALGLPAVAVPVGVADGLPQVVQVIGPRYREDLCLDASAALEDRLGVITPIDPRYGDTGSSEMSGLRCLARPGRAEDGGAPIVAGFGMAFSGRDSPLKFRSARVRPRRRARG